MLNGIKKDQLQILIKLKVDVQLSHSFSAKKL